MRGNRRVRGAVAASAGLVLAVLAVLAGTTAEAKEKYLLTLMERYPAGKVECATCHVSAQPTKKDRRLNPYGADVKAVGIVRDANGKKVFDPSRIEALDSDKDGKTNGEELKTGTHPGDPASK